MTYDAAGNVTYDGRNSYLYDAEGRVCAVSETVNGTTALTGYVYDASGIRVAKGTLKTFSCNYASSNFTATTSWVLGPGGEQVTEYSVSLGWQHTNAYASGALLATYHDTKTYFALEDWLGTKRVEIAADNSCASAFVGIPFGNTTNDNSSFTPIALPGYTACIDATEHHFTGKERDAESGNDYFGARYYASSMGRFLSPDWSAKVMPVPYATLGDPQSLNLYAYMQNNPLGGADADGHCGPIPFDICMAIANRVGNWVAGMMGGPARDGGMKPFLKNVGIGALKGTGKTLINAVQGAANATLAAQRGGALSLPRLPTPSILNPSNTTQALASTGTQVGLTAASLAAGGAGLAGAAPAAATEGGAASAADLFVIGRQADTAAYSGLSGFNVLDVPNWSMSVNEAWVQSGIDGGNNFLLASDPSDGANLFSEQYGQTVFATELDQLNGASYTQVDNQMVPPGSANVKPQ